MNDSVRAFVDWSGEFEELYKFNGQWPQSKEWVGLTDEDIEDCLEMSIQGTCRAIEAKLKEKNSD